MIQITELQELGLKHSQKRDLTTEQTSRGNTAKPSSVTEGGDWGSSPSFCLCVEVQK